jgi:hypothetical protein
VKRSGASETRGADRKGGKMMFNQRDDERNDVEGDSHNRPLVILVMPRYDLHDMDICESSLV